MRPRPHAGSELPGTPEKPLRLLPVAGDLRLEGLQRLEALLAADPRDDVYAIGRVVEDVLAAREDGKLPPELVQASEDDARQHARVALACLADAASRPSHARDVLALTQTGDSAQGGAS